VSGQVNPTLNQFDMGDTRATTAIVQPIPIQDGREIDKRQNGLGVAEPGAPAYTLDQTGAQAVAQPIGLQGNMIGRSDNAGPQGKGYTDPNDPMFTLTSTDIHGVVQPLSFDTQFGSNANVFEDMAPPLKSTQQSPSIAHAYDEYNDRLGGEVHHALRAGTKQSTGVVADMIVRRLTPTECERLMGWPDNHTRWTDTGKEQADTHRYRQCGNGVATPVAQWIAAHLKGIL
jgi:DNA (cytosine-5)-methyltransferase 1